VAARGARAAAGDAGGRVSPKRVTPWTPLDSQVGARICNGLGIMRACFETQKLEQLESRMDEIADRVARDRTNAARERTSTDEAQRYSN
jgi:hypothetical protein